MGDFFLKNKCEQVNYPARHLRRLRMSHFNSVMMIAGAKKSFVFSSGCSRYFFQSWATFHGRFADERRFKVVLPLCVGCTGMGSGNCIFRSVVCFVRISKRPDTSTRASAPDRPRPLPAVVLSGRASGTKCYGLNSIILHSKNRHKILIKYHIYFRAALFGVIESVDCM